MAEEGCANICAIKWSKAQSTKHPPFPDPPLEFKVSSAVNTRSPHCSKETGCRSAEETTFKHPVSAAAPGKPRLDASGLCSSSFLGFQAGAVSGYCTERDPDLAAKTGKQTTQTLRALGDSQVGHLPLKLSP